MLVICQTIFTFAIIILKSSHSVHSAPCVLCYYDKSKSENRIAFPITRKIVSSTRPPL